MIRIEKLNEDAQIAIMIIIAKKALSYLEKDTYTAKHIVETVGKEYPVAGAFGDIQIADAAFPAPKWMRLVTSHRNSRPPVTR